MLARREARWAEQLALQETTGCPVVSLTMVSPGPVKTGEAIRRCFCAGLSAVEAELDAHGWDVEARVAVDDITGPEALLAVRAPETDLKHAMVAIENDAPWGRLWDIDVIVDGHPLTRGSVGALGRRCLICTQAAKVCARARRHSAEELEAAVAAVMTRV